VDVKVSDAPAGAVPSFEEWAAGRVPALMRFAYLVAGGQHEAEDALQSALERACARWSRISRTDDPETYVRRMIANAHVSLWRRGRRRESPVREVLRLQESDPADRVTVADRVWRACLRLPRQQRAAVVLRYYEDREYAEIALLLSCTEATARSHVHRALQALQADLSEEEE
jgi:RNA polymerase sigma-70 factor (sigma-E family)